MTTDELLQNVQFIVDEQGRRKAAVLDYPVWEQILTILEDLEDAEELRQSRLEDEEIIPWEQAKAELRASGIDV